MDLLQLKYFQTVAKFQHMTKAADELYISQPSLSKTISQLENELGINLFDRRGKKIYINEYGKTFLKNVDKIFSLLDDSKKELKDLANCETGTINLVMLVGSSFLSDILAKFNEIHPNIYFNLIQHISPSNNVDFDLSITSSYEPPKSDNCITLLTEEIGIAVPKTHRLANKLSINLKDLENENFIRLKSGHELRNLTNIFCNREHLKLNTIFESDDPGTVRGLISTGKGVAFFPLISWKISNTENIKLLGIKDAVCKRSIYITWPENRHLSNSSQLFIEFIKSYFNKINEEYLLKKSFKS